MNPAAAVLEPDPDRRWTPIITTMQGRKPTLRTTVFDTRPDLLDAPTIGALWASQLRAGA